MCAIYSGGWERCNYMLWCFMYFSFQQRKEKYEKKAPLKWEECFKAR